MWRLCTGCGACAPNCSAKAIRLADVYEIGIRPVVDEYKCENCGDCMKVCPGIEVLHQAFDNQAIPELRESWGPVLEIWEGYASDPEIRFEGSSGGIATAIALFCLENEGFAGVLHTGTRPDSPLLNVPVLSKDRKSLLTNTGSRYSPAAPCAMLDRIEQSDLPCVFIGKPCDVAALRKLQAVNARLRDKVGCAIGIFCAGTPATEGTYRVLDELRVKPDEVEELRYRGRGWPGMTTAKTKGTDGIIRKMTYQKSWGEILNKFVPLRCRLCPDGTGEFADISCGDPWYRETEPDEPGRSLVLVRTELGRRILHRAEKSGYLRLEVVRPDVLAASQKGLLEKRQRILGRLLAMRVAFMPTPRFTGFSLRANWGRLSLLDRLRTILGTLKRIITRGWFRPASFAEHGTTEDPQAAPRCTRIGASQDEYS
jgi:coenzyme F420 hydrogenase subunit beta